jgi:hypothetical protein
VQEGSDRHWYDALRRNIIAIFFSFPFFFFRFLLDGTTPRRIEMKGAAGMLPTLFVMCNAGDMAMFLAPGPARATAFMFPTPLQSLSGVIRLNEATLADRTCGLARFGGKAPFCNR